MTRKSRDQRLIDLCHSARDWSTCDRAHVGAVVARGGEIISQGYNGAPSGRPHCDDEGHLLNNGHCTRTLHAESNALWYAGRQACDGATLYVSHVPCYNCAKEIVRARIARVVFEDDYRQDDRAVRLLMSACRLERFVDGEARAVKLVEAVR